MGREDVYLTKDARGLLAQAKAITSVARDSAVVEAALREYVDKRRARRGGGGAW